jgi:integrase/recombinase XerC/integrase/recombinase XerD
MRAVSQATYYRHLRAFFYWLVAEEVIPLSPMSRVEQPSARTDQPEHFTPEQIDALLRAAKRSRYPLRDTALILFLLDTGVRASECCSINLGDLDLMGGRAQVRGKGDKKRTVCFRSTTRRALRAYINTLPQSIHKPLFASESGQYVGERLTRDGLGILIRRLGKAARLTGVRCSPHTFRHTYTFMMLNSGAPIQSVQESLGHTDPKMTLRYSKFAHADVAVQHRRHSPVEQIAATLKKS